MDGEGGGEALAVTELKPTQGFYDYDAKYTDGLTTHICPAEVPDDAECRLVGLPPTAPHTNRDANSQAMVAARALLKVVMMGVPV